MRQAEIFSPPTLLSSLPIRADMSNEWNIWTGPMKNYNSRQGLPVTIAAAAHAGGRLRYHAVPVELMHARKNGPRQ
jgi:hypothetical protein